MAKKDKKKIIHNRITKKDLLDELKKIDNVNSVTEYQADQIISLDKMYWLLENDILEDFTNSKTHLPRLKGLSNDINGILKNMGLQIKDPKPKEEDVEDFTDVTKKP